METNTLRLVLVDDEKAMLLVLKRMLSNIPIVTVVGAFQNSEEAYHCVQKQKADMVIADIRIPGEDGFELARRLLAINPDLDLVFLTAHKEYALDAFEVHAFDYLVKPVSQERLERTVRRALEKRNPKTVTSENKARKITAYLLGGMDILTGNGGRVRWISAKSEEIFAYLVLHRGKSVSRDQIIEEIFRNMPYKNVAGYLNTAIYQLRKVLEQIELRDVIISAGDGYLFDPTDAYIDFVDFETKVNDYEKDNNFRYNDALDIVNLYGGDLFGGKAYLWSISERERLRELYASFSKGLGSQLLKNGHATNACQILIKLVRRDELDEEANCLLLKAYAALKDKSSFKRHYDKFVKVLHTELGLKPDREIVSLYEELMRN